MGRLADADVLLKVRRIRVLEAERAALADQLQPIVQELQALRVELADEFLPERKVSLP